nr:oligoribonuclease [Demequina litorisediminis]
MDGMNDFVRDMHTTSGLLPELEHGTTMEEAQAQVLAYIREHVPTAGKSPLAGNTVGMDKIFLERDMPEVMGHLHYRVVDVSSFKELVRRWYPRVFFNAPAKTGGTARSETSATPSRSLRYYREVILTPFPVPTRTPPQRPPPRSPSARALNPRSRRSRRLRAACGHVASTRIDTV